MSWGISQCHRVEYPENSEYPEIIGTFKFEYPENCEYPENIWDIKFEFLNILKDIEVSWTLSQCHKVVYTENPEYPEKYSVQYSVLSPNINILVNIQKTSSSGEDGAMRNLHQGLSHNSP